MEQESSKQGVMMVSFIHSFIRSMKNTDPLLYPSSCSRHPRYIRNQDRKGSHFQRVDSERDGRTHRQQQENTLEWQVMR